MIKNKHQYHICGWMINELHLDGKELQCYAIIYSLSQLGEGRYVAGLNFLAEFMQCSQPTASAAIKSLFKKKLIKKDEVVNEYGRRVFYYCSDDGDIKNNDDGVHKKFMDGVHKKFMDNKFNNNEYNIKEKRLSNDNQKKDEFSQDFLEFWELYDNKKNKVGTYKKWKNLSAADKKAAIAAIPAYFADCKAHNNREKKHPLTYLNQRTWEDDFTSEYDKEEKEEMQVDEIPAGDIEAWNNNQKWMQAKTPRIASKVTYQMFAKMRALATWNNKLYAEVLVEIDRSGYDGDIVAEFNRLIDKHSKV